MPLKGTAKMADSELTTHVTQIGDWTVLIVGDDLQHINELKIDEGRSVLSRAADQAVAADSHRLLIDLTRCAFFGSSFIEALFQSWKKVDGVGGELAVCGCNKDIKEVFEVTRLNNVWKIYDTREDALAADAGEA